MARARNPFAYLDLQFPDPWSAEEASERIQALFPSFTLSTAPSATVIREASWAHFALTHAPSTAFTIPQLRAAPPQVSRILVKLLKPPTDEPASLHRTITAWRRAHPPPTETLPTFTELVATSGITTEHEQLSQLDTANALIRELRIQKGSLPPKFFVSPWLPQFVAALTWVKCAHDEANLLLLLPQLTLDNLNFLADIFSIERTRPRLTEFLARIAAANFLTPLPTPERETRLLLLNFDPQVDDHSVIPALPSATAPRPSVPPKQQKNAEDHGRSRHRGPTAKPPPSGGRGQDNTGAKDDPIEIFDVRSANFKLSHEHQKALQGTNVFHSYTKPEQAIMDQALTALKTHLKIPASTQISYYSVSPTLSAQIELHPWSWQYQFAVPVTATSDPAHLGNMICRGLATWSNDPFTDPSSYSIRLAMFAQLDDIRNEIESQHDLTLHFQRCRQVATQIATQRHVHYSSLPFHEPEWFAVLDAMNKQIAAIDEFFGNISNMVLSNWYTSAYAETRHSFYLKFLRQATLRNCSNIVVPPLPQPAAKPASPAAAGGSGGASTAPPYSRTSPSSAWSGSKPTRTQFPSSTADRFSAPTLTKVWIPRSPAIVGQKGQSFANWPGERACKTPGCVAKFGMHATWECSHRFIQALGVPPPGFLSDGSRDPACWDSTNTIITEATCKQWKDFIARHGIKSLHSWNWNPDFSNGAASPPPPSGAGWPS